MMPASIRRVVLDANVLFPFSLRDTLLRAAAAGYYQLYWSEEILDETRRNLIGRGMVSEEQADRLFTAMRRAFPEAEVTDYESLIDAMPNADEDRHVSAAAVKIGAQVIATSNLRDFRTLPEGIEALSPDAFLSSVFNLDPIGVVDLLRVQAAALQKPPKTFDQLLEGLFKTVPGFVDRVRLRVAAGAAGSCRP